MTAVPWNISGSASQLFYQDKQSAQYKALLAITDVPHPNRSILGAFINEAVDSEVVAQYFLQNTCTEDMSGTPSKERVSQFLSQWDILVNQCKWMTLYSC